MPVFYGELIEFLQIVSVEMGKKNNSKFFQHKMHQLQIICEVFFPQFVQFKFLELQIAFAVVHMKI